MALSFAHSVREKHPEFSVFWVPALSVESFEQAYREIARVWEIGSVSNEQEDVKELVRRHLSATSAGKWLLVIDNADDLNILEGSETVAGLLEYLPESDLGLTIFTTRSHEEAQSLVGGDVVEIERMDQGEAMSLLERSVTRKDLVRNGALAVELLNELDCLPLAITQAAAYMNAKRESLSQYLRLIRSTEQDAVHILSTEIRDSTRYKQAASAVATTWVVSFKQIVQQDPIAADLPYFMSCIEWKAIPRSILPQTQPEARTASAIGTLCSYSFLSNRPDEQTCDMHQLVHLAIRVWHDREGDREETTRKAIAHLTEIFPLHDFSKREVWRVYLPHVPDTRGHSR